MRRAVHLLATLALAILAASGVALVGVEESAEAAFPGENGRISFVSDRNTAAFPNPEGDSEIYTMKPDGTGVKRLTSNAAEDSDPEYSASGKKIAFTRGQDNRAEIYTMNDDGSEVKRLTNNETYDAQPAWSPDGKKIAFTRSNRDREVTEIYKMNADGSGATRIVKGGCFDCSSAREDYAEEYYNPDWSPEGKKIALGGKDFLPCNADRAKSIYAVNADGSGLKRITNLERSCFPPDFSPDWSPNAKKIAFYTPGPAGGILTVNADGSGQKVIHSNTFFDEEESYDPAWSPNGKGIAFFRSGCNFAVGGMSCAESVQAVHTMRPDGSGLRRLTDRTAYEFGLDWQALPASQPPSGSCTITGSGGDNVLRGTSGSDVICGRGGNDVLLGERGADKLYGGGGNDALLGGPGKDLLVGGSGNDAHSGGDGEDRLDGKDGDGGDALNGGAGGDSCEADK